MSKGIDGSPGQGKNVGGAGTCPAMLNRQKGGKKFSEKKKIIPSRRQKCGVGTEIRSTGLEHKVVY